MKACRAARPTSRRLKRRLHVRGFDATEGMMGRLRVITVIRAISAVKITGLFEALMGVDGATHRVEDAKGTWVSQLNDCI